MSSSSSRELRPLATPELRSGVWTRFGSDNVLGDAITEETLSVLAESTRTAARSQGYAVGWAEGRRAAHAAAEAEARVVEQARRASEERRAAEHDAAVAALELAATHVHAAVASTCAEVEDQASALAWELVRAIVGHTVSLQAGPDAVRRALDLAPTAPDQPGDLARLRLHPEDAAVAYAHAEVLSARGITVVGDPTLRRGDALVETAESVTDLRIETALERVREVLR